MDRTEQNRVKIFDTTLRDGEQSPGISLNKQEKLEIAHQLARLGVDIIEAGFPISSPGDFEAVQAIAREVHGPVICGLARAERAGHRRRLERGQGLRAAAHPHLHLHQRHPHRAPAADDPRGREGPGPRGRGPGARSTATTWSSRPMDATRSDLEFTAEVLQIALDEGATTINVPDTVGYSMPDEYAAMWRELYRLVPGLADVTTSVHCHDDLGLAVANSFAGVRGGRRQVECAINGIGERAGNASLEEIVMLLHVREAAHGLWTGVDTREIARTSRMVSRLTGYQVQPNKAIVGRNAFAHESGIHQDGVLKERTTYEIMDATTIGLEANSLVLGKHSGRHALRNALEELGFKVDGRRAEHRLQALQGAGGQEEEGHGARPRGDRLRRDEAGAGGVRARVVRHRGVVHALARSPRVSVRLPDGEVESGSFTGDGPVDAFFSALNAATGHEARLEGVPRVRGHRRARRARRGDRAARARRPASRPASACPPTSSRRPARPTCARSRTPSRTTWPPRRSACSSARPRRHPPRRGSGPPSAAPSRAVPPRTNTIAAPWPPSPSRCATVSAPSASGRARRLRRPICFGSHGFGDYALLTTRARPRQRAARRARYAGGRRAAGARGRDLGRAPARRPAGRAARGPRRRARDRHRQGDRRRHRSAGGGDPDHALRRRAHALPPHARRRRGRAHGAALAGGRRPAADGLAAQPPSWRRAR